MIPDAKITDYLLKNPGKAYFFLRFGFTLAQWHELRDALLLHLVTHAYAQEIVVDDGVKYVVEGDLQSPDGRNSRVRPVWMIGNGMSNPRLITTYARA